MTTSQVRGETCLSGSWKALTAVYVLSGAWHLGRTSDLVFNISKVAEENKLRVFLLP